MHIEQNLHPVTHLFYVHVQDSLKDITEFTFTANKSMAYENVSSSTLFMVQPPVPISQLAHLTAFTSDWSIGI